jgi:hypothetical protein
MPLHGRETNIVHDRDPTGLIGIDKYSKLLDIFGQLLDDLSRRFWIDITRALLVEHKSQRICPGLDRELCVVQIRRSTDFDPGHGNAKVLESGSFSAEAIGNAELH